MADPRKAEDNLVRETDGTFFEEMRQMERNFFIERSDMEALAELDREEQGAAEAAARADALDAMGAFNPVAPGGKSASRRFSLH